MPAVFTWNVPVPLKAYKTPPPPGMGLLTVQLPGDWEGEVVEIGLGDGARRRACSGDAQLAREQLVRGRQVPQSGDWAAAQDNTAVGVAGDDAALRRIIAGVVAFGTDAVVAAAIDEDAVLAIGLDCGPRRIDADVIAPNPVVAGTVDEDAVANESRSMFEDRRSRRCSSWSWRPLPVFRFLAVQDDLEDRVVRAPEVLGLAPGWL